MLYKVVMLATHIWRRKKGHVSPQSLTILRVDFGPITACLIHRVTTRTYVHISPWWQYAEVTGEAVEEFPIPPFGKHICHHSNGIKLHNMQKSAGSAVGDISIHQGDQAAIQGVTGQTIVFNL